MKKLFEPEHFVNHMDAELCFPVSITSDCFLFNSIYQTTYRRKSSSNLKTTRDKLMHFESLTLNKLPKTLGQGMDIFEKIDCIHESNNNIYTLLNNINYVEQIYIICYCTVNTRILIYNQLHVYIYYTCTIIINSIINLLHNFT